MKNLSIIPILIIVLFSGCQTQSEDSDREYNIVRFGHKYPYTQDEYYDKNNDFTDMEFEPRQLNYTFEDNHVHAILYCQVHESYWSETDYIVSGDSLILLVNELERKESHSGDNYRMAYQMARIVYYIPLEEIKDTSNLKVFFGNFWYGEDNEDSEPIDKWTHVYNLQGKGGSIATLRCVFEDKQIQYEYEVVGLPIIEGIASLADTTNGLGSMDDNEYQESFGLIPYKYISKNEDTIILIGIEYKTAERANVYVKIEDGDSYLMDGVFRRQNP